MAAAGVPTSASLAQKLAEIEQSLAPASAAAPSDWVERTRENLSNLVNLHPVDEEAVPGENAVRGAREALLLQDLPGAVAAMKPLGGPGQRAGAGLDRRRRAAAGRRRRRRHAAPAPQDHAGPSGLSRQTAKETRPCFASSSSSPSPALLAWAAVWVVNHPGTVVVQWLDQELILSVGTVIAALFAFGALAVILFEVLRVIVGLPGSWRVSRGRRTQMRGYEELTRGLMAVAAGDLNAARNYHRQAERHLPDNGSLLLLQAQTAQLEGKEEIAHLKFRQMLDRRDAEFVGLRGLLAQAMKTGDFAEGLTLARRAYRRSPTTPWVLTTLFELLARDGKWDEALPLVDEMQAQGLLDAGAGQAQEERPLPHAAPAACATRTGPPTR